MIFYTLNSDKFEVLKGFKFVFKSLHNSALFYFNKYLSTGRNVLYVNTVMLPHMILHGPGSVVDRATGYRMDGPGSNPGISVFQRGVYI